jgi:hypothetical protein
MITTPEAGTAGAAAHMIMGLMSLERHQSHDHERR